MKATRPRRGATRLSRMLEPRRGAGSASVAISAADFDGPACRGDERALLVVEGELARVQRGDDRLPRVEAPRPAAPLACRDPAEDASRADVDDDVEVAPAELRVDDDAGEADRV